MLFDCPDCGALNGVSTASIGEAGSEITCRRCKKNFHVNKPKDKEGSTGSIPADADSTVAEPSAPAADSEAKLSSEPELKIPKLETRSERPEGGKPESGKIPRVLERTESKSESILPKLGGSDRGKSDSGKSESGKIPKLETRSERPQSNKSDSTLPKLEPRLSSKAEVRLSSKPEGALPTSGSGASPAPSRERSNPAGGLGASPVVSITEGEPTTVGAVSPFAEGVDVLAARGSSVSLNIDSAPPPKPEPFTSDSTSPASLSEIQQGAAMVSSTLALAGEPTTVGVVSDPLSVAKTTPEPAAKNGAPPARRPSGDREIAVKGLGPADDGGEAKPSGARVGSVPPGIRAIVERSPSKPSPRAGSPAPASGVREVSAPVLRSPSKADPTDSGAPAEADARAAFGPSLSAQAKAWFNALARPMQAAVIGVPLLLILMVAWGTHSTSDEAESIKIVPSQESGEANTADNEAKAAEVKTAEAPSTAEAPAKAPPASKPTAKAEAAATAPAVPAVPAAVPPPDSAKPSALGGPIGRLATDTPAPTGSGYLKTDAKLLSRPGAGGGSITRLPAGSEVRHYEEIEGFTLILVPPRGPVGFVPSAALGALKPISMLAHDLGLRDRCDAAASAEECSATARKETDACLAQCGTPTPDTKNAADNDLGARCVQACQMAFDECDKSCSKPRKHHGHKGAARHH